MTKETFYKYQNGQRVKMTNKEVKAYIMKVNGWTNEQYRKQYDLFKNKLRAYESYKTAQGSEVKQQSVVSVLFKEAKSKRHYGAEYTPSRKLQQIRNFKAYSITKGRQIANTEAYKIREAKKYGEYISGRFGNYDPNNPKKNNGFIGSNKGAQAIVDAFIKKAEESGQLINYAKMEDALSAYADKVNAKINEQDEVTENEAIPFGETFGSNDEIDFDIDSYL